MLNWFAWCYQRRVKSTVILVFVGKPGTGKSTLFYDASRNCPIFAELYGTTYMGTGVPPRMLSSLPRGPRSFIAPRQLSTPYAHSRTAAAARTGGLTQLTARFNLISGNKLFCVADKAGTANYANLKSLADRTKIEIEGKYLDTVEVNDHRNFVMCTNYKNAFGFDGDTDDFSRKVALFEVRQLHLVRMRASPSPRTHTPTPRAASDPSCKSANPSK